MLTKWLTSTFATDCWRPRQEKFLPSVAFLFNEDRESVEKKKLSFTGGGRTKRASNFESCFVSCKAFSISFVMSIYWYYDRWLWFLHNNTATIKYYASCMKQEKHYRNYIVFCRMVFKYVCFSFSVLKICFTKYRNLYDVYFY